MRRGVVAKQQGHIDCHPQPDKAVCAAVDQFMGGRHGHLPQPQPQGQGAAGPGEKSGRAGRGKGRHNAPGQNRQRSKSDHRQHRIRGGKFRSFGPFVGQMRQYLIGHGHKDRHVGQRRDKTRAKA